MGEGETVGALGDFDFQAVVWGGGDALDALSGADFEHFAAFPYGFAVGREENGGCAAYGDCHLKLAHVAVVAQDTRAEEALGRVEAVVDAVESWGRAVLPSPGWQKSIAPSSPMDSGVPCPSSPSRSTVRPSSWRPTSGPSSSSPVPRVIRVIRVIRVVRVLRVIRVIRIIRVVRVVRIVRGIRVIREREGRGKSPLA